MNTNSKTKKLNKFNVSPLVAAVAILEVIILICVSTYAWFIFAENNRVHTDYISVEPDSGLEIDFSQADTQDYVNIWNYLEEFTFEPVTSIDGRNIYIPTTGTFNSTDTTNMIFREATVNDMNSKYICIDFSLSNNSAADMPVFLSSASSFKFNNSTAGKALRLAFYQNDGSKGDVKSTLLNQDNGDQDKTTVYFYNTLGWEQPYAHIWKDNEDDTNDEALEEWPGTPMTKISGNIYYCTFDNMYDSVIFNDGSGNSNAPQTEDISPTAGKAVQDGFIYTLGAPVTETSNEYTYSAVDYTGIVSTGTYPVISPGVSTGFQRPYAPVVELDSNTGNATSIVPAFASSIDDYNYGSSKELFEIKAGQTLSLSMIVWLEGTDPDCSADIYAGKDIDMNLVFATTDSGEDIYTFKFLDKTKENWIKSPIETVTGVKFNPVMQLYDADNDKGYLMKVADDNKTWTCEAPQDLINSNNIMFRRVNPMNEDEVWNFWDTYGFYGMNAFDNGMVYYTAFADGAPTNIEEANAPLKSNGGMWGNHETKEIILYDGTKDTWLNNDSAALTINYEYNGQFLEYKASFGNGMYYFVVPECICDATSTSRPSVSFKRYYEFNTKYAINAQEYQEDLKYDRTFDFGTLGGMFAEINQNPSGDYVNIWGSDLLYIQSASVVNSKFDSGVWQVKFYSKPNGDETSGTHKYVYLYKNNYYSDGMNGYGYPCVVPSDKTYYSFKVERCNPEKTTERWNTTDVIDINYDDRTTVVKMYNNTVEKNICKITHLEHTIYFQMSADYCSQTTVPELYAWTEGTENRNAAWPGVSMEYVSTVGSGSLNKYKVTVDVTNNNQAIFSIERPAIYIDTNNNNIAWNSGGAWFAAYFWNTSNSKNYWVRGTAISDDKYEFIIPPGTWHKVLFCRMNPNNSEFIFNNGRTDDDRPVWNQSQDLDLATANHIAKVENWNSFGSWQSYSPSTESRIQSYNNQCFLGGSGDKNGMIVQGNVSGNTINIEKLQNSDKTSVLVENGEDPALSLKYEFHNDTTKFI